MNSNRRLLGPHPLSIGVLCFALTVCLGATRANASLPKLGDPADTIFTPEEEYRLGQQLLVDVRNRLPVVQDAELNYYINNLGTQLTNVSDNTQFPFTFAIVDDPTLNAFAMPGGIIVIHRGIMETSESEGELASVVSHEIAHVTQRHLARMYQNSKGLSLKTALGVLAAILIGTQDSEAGQATLYGTMAAGQSERLAFTRENEREADRIGRDILERARYDVSAMTSFFTRLKAQSMSNPDEIVEFLRTHPLTDQRIADSMMAARQEPEDIEPRDELDFRFARARLQALYEKPDLRRRHLGKTDINAGPEDLYRDALRHHFEGDHKTARDLLGRLREPYRSHLSVELLSARLDAADGRKNSALKALTELNVLYPDNPAIMETLGTVWLENGTPEKTFTLLNRYTSLKEIDINLLKLKAEAARDTGKLAYSHEALAEYYYYSGDIELALDQVRIALRQDDLSNVMRTRLEQNVADLEPVVEMVKKRRQKEARKRNDRFNSSLALGE